MLCIFVIWCNSQKNNTSNQCVEWNACYDDVNQEIDAQTYREVEDNASENNGSVPSIADTINNDSDISAGNRNN